MTTPLTDVDLESIPALVAEVRQAWALLEDSRRAFVTATAFAQQKADEREAELRATIANERGEGDPPVPGWAWSSGERGVSAEAYNNRRAWRNEVARAEVKPALSHPPGLVWWWGVEIVGDWRKDPQGFAATAREAMRAAAAATPESP